LITVCKPVFGCGATEAHEVSYGYEIIYLEIKFFCINVFIPFVVSSCAEYEETGRMEGPLCGPIIHCP